MRLDGAQELALLHGERANREIDGRALLQQQQRFQQVAESLPPESATATRSPSRIIWKRWMASPTLRRSVFSRSTDSIIRRPQASLAYGPAGSSLFAPVASAGFQCSWLVIASQVSWSKTREAIARSYSFGPT